MRIGFDVSQTGRTKAGCGYLADGLIRELSKIDAENEYVLYPAVGDVFWDPDCARDTFHCNLPNFRRQPAPKSFEASQSFWRNPGEDFDEALGSPDIFHANNFYCPSGLRRARLIYTLYDLAFISHPDWTTEANRLGCFYGMFRASLKADLIVSISESSRKHFLEVFPHYPADRVVVVYPGSRFPSPVELPRPEALRRFQPGKFWLSVATLEPRKNHKRLLRAYAALKQKRPDPLPLVLCGGKGWLMDEFESELASLGLTEDVILTGYLENDALQWLYQNCFAFVYPSYFEGFGLPVLEAMSLGAPVIASKATSIPEIVGSAGLLIDPYDEASILSAMERLLGGEVSRDRLRSAGREQASLFSWEASARQMLELYRQVALPEYRCLAEADQMSVAATTS